MILTTINVHDGAFVVTTAKEQRCHALKQDLKASVPTLHTANWLQTDVNLNNYTHISAPIFHHTANSFLNSETPNARNNHSYAKRCNHLILTFNIPTIHL